MRRVLVIGLPRGGTTWVGETLGRTKGAVHVHEPDGVHEPFAFRARLLDGVDHHAVLAPGDVAPEYERLWAGAFAGGAPARGLQAAISRRAFRGVAVEQRQAARDGGARPLRLRLAVRTARPHGPRPGLTAVVVKSVNAALAAEWVWDAFRPEVVVVRRDLRNVLASWLQMGFGPPRPRVYDVMRAEAVRRWGVDLAPSDDPTVRTATLCAVLRIGLHDALGRHAEWHVLSHEAACLDPARTLAEAARATGLEWTDAAQEFVETSNRPGSGYATNRVASGLPGQWEQRLSAAQVAAIEGVLERFPAELQEAALG